MLQLALHYLVLPLVAALLTRLAAKYKLAASVIEMAREILADPHSDVTDPKQAVEQALIKSQFDSLTPVVKKLDEQILTGKLEVQQAHERGLASSKGMDITIVEPDGTERKVDTGP